MTVKEAAGVDEIYFDKKTGKRISDKEFARRVIDFLGGLDEVKKFIPFPLEILKEKYKEDPNFNNTPTKKWFLAAGYCFQGEYVLPIIPFQGLWILYREHGITKASSNEGVYILIEAAKMLVLEDQN